MAGLSENEKHIPLWLLAEITYACPLQCVYCSNPTNFTDYKGELSTKQWKSVISQARELGSTQLGFSGGEPLVRKDLVELVAHANELDYYTNLITSAIGMNEEKIKDLKKAGLDNIQISFQAHEKALNDFISGKQSFNTKIEMTNLVKQYDYPLTLNIVIHKMNIDYIQDIMDMCLSLKADYVELANTQYYGFAKANQQQLLPTAEQLKTAEKIVHEYQARYKEIIKFYYIISDYYENRPKACMNGWGTTSLCITPDGYALPCQMARVLPNLTFPKVTENKLAWIWNDSDLFQKFRGFEWMEEPCRSCPERFKDYGGCRCQAYLLTGNACATDPVCDLSPKHDIVLKIRQQAGKEIVKEYPLIYRSPRNSKKFSKS